MEPNESKLKELILYIANESVDDPDFGATKLNKILFFSDFLAYTHLGSPVTGVEYQKLRYGPAPKRLLPVQEELRRRGELAEAPVERFYTQKRAVALRSPNLSQFTADEVSLIDDVIKALRGRTAANVSKLSHLWSVAWRAAQDHEVIPYETAYWGRHKENEEQDERAHQIAVKYDLLDDSIGAG